MSPDSFAPVEPSEPGHPAGTQPPAVPSVPFSQTISTTPPPVIAPAKKQDRTFRILLAVAALVAVGGVTFAIGRVTAPAAAATTRGGFAAGGFGAGTGAGAAGAGGLGGRGGFGGGVLITGTVDSISGTTMTLKEANGTTVTVNLAGTTTYHSQAAATAADVTTGKQVQVEVQVAGGFGGADNPAASPGAAASPAAGAAGVPTRTITARDITLVTP